MTPRLIISVLEAWFLISQLFLAGKDATSYRMKDVKTDALTAERLARWHRDGLILALLCLGPLLYIAWEKEGWEGLLFVLGGAFLIRCAFYDVAFNIWAGLPAAYLGTTAKSDGLWSRIFGVQGAVRKMFVFGILLIALQFFVR